MLHKALPIEYNYELNMGILRSMNVIAIVLQSIWIAISLPMGINIVTPAIFLILYGFNLAVLYKTRRYRLCAHVFIGITFLATILSVAVYGGFYSTAVLWMPMFSPLAFYLLGRRSGVIWALSSSSIIMVVAFASTHYKLYLATFDFETYLKIGIFTVAFSTLIISSLAVLFVNSRNSMVIKMYKKKEQASQLLMDNKRLFATIVHDIVNPLSAIQGTAELARMHIHKNKDSTDHNQILDFLERQMIALNNINKIVSHVRLMEGLEAGKIAIAAKPLDMKDIMNDLVTIFGMMLEEKSIRLVSDISEERVFAEHYSLVTNVLGNLLSNAIKFSYPGGDVRISSGSNFEGFTIIEVEDYGIGIPPNIMSNLFSMHDKTTRNGTCNERGTGFGMPIVKKYVELYHGSIDIISNVDSSRGPTGTLFRLKIPTSAATSINITA